MTCFALGANVRAFGASGFAGRVPRFGHQVHERRRADAHTALLEEPAARNVAWMHTAIEVVLAAHHYSFVMVSSRFKITRDTTVHAANRRGVVSPGTAVWPVFNPARSIALSQPSASRRSSFASNSSSTSALGLRRHARGAEAECVCDRDPDRSVRHPSRCAPPRPGPPPQIAAHSAWSAPAAECSTARAARTPFRRWAHRRLAAPDTAQSGNGKCRARAGSGRDPARRSRSSVRSSPAAGRAIPARADKRWDRRSFGEQAARLQRDVAHQFGIHAKARAARDQSIVRDLWRGLARDIRALPIRRRRGDQALEFLQAPPGIHELHRQPVEQLLDSTVSRLRSQILRRRDDARPEVRLPHAIDDRPRRCRRLPVHQPAREAQAVGRRTGRQLMQERRHARRDFTIGLQEIAALQNVGDAPVFRRAPLAPVAASPRDVRATIARWRHWRRAIRAL